MMHWSETLQLTANDPAFTLCEISALLGVLGQQGIGAQSVLEQAQIDVGSLSDPASRISLSQHCQIQSASTALYGDSRLIPKLAQRLHLTAFGIAGYALLSCSNLNELIQFADRYSPLLNLKFSLQVRLDGPRARLCFVDRYVMDEAMRTSCAVLELAKVGVLLRDVLGDAFLPLSAQCTGADPAQLGELAEILGCTVQPSAGVTELCVEASVLERVLPQSNSATHAGCRIVCDQLMAGLASRFDLERHVREILLKATGRPPALPELADELCISQRTLRRRLDALNTSYQQILEGVRKELAIRYLTTTRSTTEEIAQLLGYSEAANFRHAFKRWTSKSPKDFRVTRGGDERPSRAYPAEPQRSHTLTHTRTHSSLLSEATACWGQASRGQPDALARAAFRLESTTPTHTPHDMTRILILGASGHIGGLTAKALSQQHPDLTLRLTSSRQEGAAALQQRHPMAEVVVADWYDLDSLHRACGGVDKVLVVTPDFATDETVVTPNIIQAVKAAGSVSQLLRLIAIPPGLTAADLAPEFLATRCGANLHVIAKPLLDASGLPVTYINAACWIMFNLPWFLAEQVRQNRQIEMPAASDAPRLWLSEDDIAEVAAKLLADNASDHVGKEYLLTGTERFDFRQLAQLLGAVVGQEITVSHSDRALRQTMGEHFDTLMTYFRHETRDYAKVPITNTVEQLLGRPPVTLQAYAQARRDLFV